MQKRIYLYIFFLAVFILTGCGGGNNSSAGGNIDDVVVDPQAYYIDAVEGNDNNDGKSPATAWKTLAKVNSITINAGNKILFRTGQIWHGQLTIKNSGTPDNPIEIGAYGKGAAAPILSALGVVNLRENNNNGDVEDGEWIPYNAVGGNGLGIQFKEPVQDPANTWLAVILNTHPDRIKVNGREVLGAFDSSELSNTFKWSYNRDKGGTVFYWYGNDKPDNIETNLYASPLYIHNAKHIEISKITLEGGYVASLFIEKSDNITVQNCTLGNMAKQGIYVKAEQSNVSNISIMNNIIDSQYILDYSMATPNLSKNGRTTTTRGASEGITFWGGVKNSVIAYNTLKNWTHASINFSNKYEEELSGNTVHHNQLSAPNIAYGGRIGVDGKNTFNNEFYENTIHDIRAPIQLNGHDNTFHNNTIYNIYSSVLKPNETGYAVVLQAYTSPVYNNSIVNNRFKNIEKEAIKIIPPNVSNITINGNTIE